MRRLSQKENRVGSSPTLGTKFRMTTANNSTRQNLGGQSSGDIDMGSTPGFKSKHPVLLALLV